MKSLISLIILIILIVLFPGKTQAADATPSAKAQDLLDRVATKVAALSEKLQKSYRGRIKTLGTSTIILTVNDSEKTVSTNDATSFYRLRAGNRTEVNFAALKIGDDLAALGTIDPTTSDLTARQIIAKISRKNVVGQITSVDKTVITVGETKLDLDGATLKQASLSGKITTARLADFKKNATIFAIAVPSDQSSSAFSVLKALVLR